MKKFAPLFFFCVFGAATVSLAHASNVTAGKTVKVSKASKPDQTSQATSGADGAVPDVKELIANEYNCELGNKLTIYASEKDEQHLALRWKKMLLQLTRVETTTGANRFENRSSGLIWINIPSKGILLDAKKGQQLANECKKQ